MLLETVREIYNFEHERMEKFPSKITFYLIIISLEINVLSEYYNKYKFPLCYNAIDLLFIISCLITIIILFISFITIYKSIWGYSYGILPEPESIKEYHKKLEEYYDENYDKFFKNQNENKETLIYKDFKNFLIEEYANTAQFNRNNNNKRSYFIHISGFLIFISVITLLITLVIYYFIK